VRDEADQARYVVEKVLENREAGLALKTQAVLYTNVRMSTKPGQLQRAAARGARDEAPKTAKAAQETAGRAVKQRLS
jgi:hypothetical protein